VAARLEELIDGVVGSVDAQVAQRSGGSTDGRPSLVCVPGGTLHFLIISRLFIYEKVVASLFLSLENPVFPFDWGTVATVFYLGSVGMILAQALFKQKGKMEEKCYVSLLSVTCCTGCKTSCQLDCGGLWSLGKGFCSGISPGAYKYVFPLYYNL
jgi:hypothetical protein